MVTHKYKYDDAIQKREGPKYVERKIPIHVGARGCRRRPEHMASHFMPCLGDTIILPFFLDPPVSDDGHSFGLSVHTVDEQQVATRGEIDTQAIDADKNESVSNPVAENLKYLGSLVRILFHRVSGYTANFHVTFEALKPARLNLALSSVVKDPSMLGRTYADSFPIIIVERGTPVAWLAARESVHHRSEGFSSGTDNS